MNQVTRGGRPVKVPGYVRKEQPEGRRAATDLKSA